MGYDSNQASQLPPVDWINTPSRNMPTTAYIGWVANSTATVNSAGIKLKKVERIGAEMRGTARQGAVQQLEMRCQ
jgi:hypothetical protein